MKKILAGLVFVFIMVGVAVAGADGQFAFPGKGKVGFYTNSFGDGQYRTIIYYDRDDQFVQVVSWYNGICQDTVTQCVYRGWGEFLPDSSLLIHLFYRGNTIAPDEATLVDSFRVFPDGTVTFSSGGGSFSMSLVFFGTNPQDGVYFTQQWGCVPSGELCAMRLLDENIGPWHLDWDLEIISITDTDGDTYFVMPAIGRGRIGMEYGWAHTFSDGIHRPAADAACPFWLFDNTPGCTNPSVALPYGDGWWLTPAGLGGPVSWINGRGVRATTRDPRILEEYKKRGPVCHDPTIPGCFPE